MVFPFDRRHLIDTMIQMSRTPLSVTAKLTVAGLQDNNGLVAELHFDFAEMLSFIFCNCNTVLLLLAAFRL